MMSSPFKVIRENTKTGGALILTMEGREGQAKMTFTNAGKTHRIVDHTEVDEGLRGAGAGQTLATEMVAEARWEGVKLIPLCPFFRATAAKHPEWHDVVKMPASSKLTAEVT